MNRKTTVLIGILFTFVLLLSGCNIAKSYSETVEIDLPDNQKLINVTWEDSSLWYLTREMTEEDKEETYQFNEKRAISLKSGKFTIQEHKK